jgi:hypothetical protein
VLGRNCTLKFEISTHQHDLSLHTQTKAITPEFWDLPTEWFCSCGWQSTLGHQVEYVSPTLLAEHLVNPPLALVQALLKSTENIRVSTFMMITWWVWKNTDSTHFVNTMFNSWGYHMMSTQKMHLKLVQRFLKYMFWVCEKLCNQIIQLLFNPETMSTAIQSYSAQ